MGSEATVVRDNQLQIPASARGDYMGEDQVDQEEGKVYEDIYRNVMAQAVPGSQGHRIRGAAPVSSFDAYKQSWNKIQDRTDRSY